MIGGIITICTTFLIAVCSTWSVPYLYNRDQKNDGFFGLLSLFISIFSISTLLVLLIYIPVNHNRSMCEIEKLKAFETTITSARKNDDYSSRYVLEEIIERNEWIAEAKHDNHNYWDLWTPDEVDDLKLIE